MRTRAALVAVVPLAFIAVFFLYPVANIVDAGLRPGGRFDGSALAALVTNAPLRGVIGFTVLQALASTALTLALGLPLAYAVARYRFPGRSVIKAMLVVAFVLPTVVVATAFGSLMGEGIASILASHVFLNLAVVVLVAGAAMAHVDPSLEDAAAVLGAGRLRALWEALLVVRSSIASAVAVVFLFTFSSFGVVLLLGQAGQATVEVEIYRRTTQLLDLPVAAALSLLQMGVAGVTGWLVARQERAAAGREHVPAEAAARAPGSRSDRAFILVTTGLAMTLVLSPVLVLVHRSLATQTGYTLSRYAELGEVKQGGILAISPLGAVGTSLGVGAAAAALALVIGGLASAAAAAPRGYAGPVRFLVMLPLAVSAVTVGFGYVISMDEPPLELRGSTALLPIAQAVVALPFVVRLLVPALRETAAGPREAAANLGATPAQVRREIVVPLVWRAGLAAATLAFAVSLGEFGATAFLARLDTPTMPVAIARLLDQPGAAALGQAHAMSVVLMLVTAGTAIAIERIRPGVLGRT
jgi:thiamine transport system permease protein